MYIDSYIYIYVILVLKHHCYNGAVPKTKVQSPLLPAAAAKHVILACV